MQNMCEKQTNSHEPPVFLTREPNHDRFWAFEIEGFDLKKNRSSTTFRSKRKNMTFHHNTNKIGCYLEKPLIYPFCRN